MTGDDAQGSHGWMAQIVHALLDEPVVDRDSSAAQRRRIEEFAGARQDRQALPAALHRWFATCVSRLLIEAVTRDEQSDDLQRAVQQLHFRVGRGGTVEADAWHAALVPCLQQVYRLAYDSESAFATASAAAAAFASSRGYGADEAAEYGQTYASMNTEASSSAFADGNAFALAGLLAASFASADAEAYARTYPASHIRACVYACAKNDEERRRVRAALLEGLAREFADVATTA